MPSFSINVNSLPVEFKVCIALDITSIVLVLLVLELSFRKGRNFNLGPRIFTVNLMVFDLLHSICGLFLDSTYVYPGIASFLDNLGIYWPMNHYSFTIQSWVLLVFNASFVPMMSMSIMAATSSYGLTDTSSILYFIGFVLLADVVPTVFQVTNVAVTGYYLSASIPYACASYFLYAIQLALTAAALRILFKKRSQNLDHSNKTHRSNLTNILLFSIAPCLIQAPFALQQLTNVLRVQYDFWMTVSLLLSWPVRMMFALKPAMDALSILLFLGEYRQTTLSVYAAVKRFVTRSSLSITKVVHLQSVSSSVDAASTRLNA